MLSPPSSTPRKASGLISDDSTERGRVRELDRSGFRVDLTPLRWLAIDHLDGKLFIDRISRLKRDLYTRRRKKMLRSGTEPERETSRVLI